MVSSFDPTVNHSPTHFLFGYKVWTFSLLSCRLRLFLLFGSRQKEKEKERKWGWRRPECGNHVRRRGCDSLVVQLCREYNKVNEIQRERNKWRRRRRIRWRHVRVMGVVVAGPEWENTKWVGPLVRGTLLRWSLQGTVRQEKTWPSKFLTKKNFSSTKW